MKLPAALLFSSFALLAQKPPALPPDATPQDVRDFIRGTAEALTNKDATAFLDHFDGKMPEFETLSLYVQSLAARNAVISSIEIVADKGDNQQRSMDLDWTLTVDDNRQDRQIVKVRIEKQGKKWKITSLEPLDFFRPPPL